MQTKRPQKKYKYRAVSQNIPLPKTAYEPRFAWNLLNVVADFFLGPKIVPFTESSLYRLIQARQEQHEKDTQDMLLKTLFH